jgi:hypothetical protein
MGHEMRFRSLLIAMLLLIVFGGHSYAQTKPRKFGIGVRWIFLRDITRFADKDLNYYVGSDDGGSVNLKSQSVVPFFIQFDETLFNNWSFTSLYFDFNQTILEDVPPELAGDSYSGLADDNSNKTEFEINSNQTFISEFSNNFPEYKSIIDAANNPTLSADLELEINVTFGKNWGIFIPIGDRHRILPIGLGFGVGYSEGHYKINVCDPYIVKTKFTEGSNSKYREGICKNKNTIISEEISNISFSFNTDATIYSYIGEKYEFNFYRVKHFITNNAFTESLSSVSSKKIYPVSIFRYYEIASFIYSF